MFHFFILEIVWIYFRGTGRGLETVCNIEYVFYFILPVETQSHRSIYTAKSSGWKIGQGSDMAEAHVKQKNPFIFLAGNLLF